MITIIVSVALVLAGMLLMLDFRKSSLAVAVLAIAGGYSYRWASTGEDFRTIVAEICFFTAVAVICWFGAKEFLGILDQDSKNTNSLK